MTTFDFLDVPFIFNGYAVIGLLLAYTLLSALFISCCCCKSGKAKQPSEISKTHDKVVEVLDEVVRMRESMSMHLYPFNRMMSAAELSKRRSDLKSEST